MTGQLMVAVGRRAAWAILIDDLGRLALITRAKPGQASNWAAPGGGVEDTGASVTAASYREVAEELGAQAAAAWQVFLFGSSSDAGVGVRHLLVTRVAGVDESARGGPKFGDLPRSGSDEVGSPGPTCTVPGHRGL